ncbi:DUF4135 domain-containing protein [Microbacterium sp.]|uniref:DUF4135 domain-containing protein n=1 Tax=Microbacterium sp. TaxID=51671 RepID=UPI003F956C3E
MAQFVASSARIARPSITSALVRKGLAWEAAEDAWEALADPAIAAGLLDNVPTIRSRIQGLAQTYERSAALLASRINDPVVESLGGVSHIRLLGDMHVRGAVALLYVRNEPTLVYKPRSLALDNLLASVLERLRERVHPAAAPKHPRSFERDGYGFQEYVRYSSPSPGEERASFYEQYGVLIALSYVLRFNDLHCENLLATSQGPVVLDAECLLNFSSSLEQHLPVGPMYGARPNVIDSGLLPSWRTTFRSAGPREVSALGYYAHTDRLQAVRSAAVIDGNVNYVYERRGTPGAMPHQPHEAFGTFPAGPYFDDVLRGFDATYEAFLDQDFSAEIVQLVRSVPEARTRVVTADSAAYDALLQSNKKAAQPSSPRSRLQENLFDSEQFALTHGVIPLFERRLSDGALLLENGQILEGSVSTPWMQLEEHLSQLSPADKQDQRELVEMSLQIGAYNPSDRPSVAIALPAVSDLSTRIDTLVSTTTEAIRDQPGTPWTFTSTEPEPNYFTLHSAPPGLYSGTIGTIYGLGIAGLEHKGAERAYRSLSGRFLETAVDLTNERHYAGADRLSLTGSGLLGPLVALSSIAELESDHATLKTVASLASPLSAIAGTPRGLDIIDGASGAAIGLGRLFELTNAEEYRVTQTRVVQQLIDALPAATNEHVPAVGLAHGLSGIAIALHSAADRADLQGLRESARLCLELEDHLMASGAAREAGSSGSWCWGATGQLAARLVCAPSSTRIARLREIVRTTRSDQFGICHGLAGPALLMRGHEYTQRFGYDDARSAPWWVETLPSRPGARANAPDFAPDAGLFTGAAGVLVYLCTLRDDATFSLHDLRYQP